MKKWLIISGQIGILMIFYWVGVWIKQAFHLFIPGSMIGMFLLFILLLTKLLPLRFIENGSFLILKHMPLLFLPVTVGILQFFDLFSGKGMVIIWITLLSTVIVLVTVGLLGQKMLQWKGKSK